MTRSVIVIADDLIWSSRLRAAVEKAGASPSMATSAEGLRDQSPESPVIVDLNGRVYDGIAAVAAACDLGHRVLAVGQHEDQALRKRALEAGAVRVFSYNKLFSDGPDVVARLIEGDL